MDFKKKISDYSLFLRLNIHDLFYFFEDKIRTFLFYLKWKMKAYLFYLKWKMYKKIFIEEMINDEFHPMLDMNFNALLNLNKRFSKKYKSELFKVRSILHEKDLDKN